MKTAITRAIASSLAGIILASSQLHAAPLLQVGDFIIAIDTDEPAQGESVSNYPPLEHPGLAFDESTNTKYLNSGKLNSGVILSLGAPTTIKSMILYTANDAVERDPASWSIWGTNEEISTPDNYQGPSLENWTLIAEGNVALPTARRAAGPVLSFAENAIPYDAYRITFPTLRDVSAANAMQISEISLFQTIAGSGPPITRANSSVARAIDLEQVDTIRYQSSSPGGEHVENLLDGNKKTTYNGAAVLTKYFNFGGANSGFIVTPQGGASTVTSFQLTTAFDESQRDPASYVLYGTNDDITSEPHSQGLAENWVEIASGSLALPGARDFVAGPVTFSNVTAYESYRMIFPTLKSAGNAMQIAGAQFFGEFVGTGADVDMDDDVDGADFLALQRSASSLADWKSSFGDDGASAVPEPGAIVLTLAGVVALAFRRAWKGLR